MAELGIDQSRLPGVKEVCRDFAVLEDHTLAHSLQEQEIEHHLATNVQRNRLVQGDLQVAKQLQEEEDRKAQDHLQGQHRDLEQQDCAIAQEIQVKLAIEAERQKRQEAADEDIARILQQHELREEKRRKKPPPGLLLQSPTREGHHLEGRECLPGSPELPRPSRPPQTREPRRGLPLLSEDLDLEVWGSSPKVRRDREKPQDGNKQRPRKAPLATEEKEPSQRGHSSRAPWEPYSLVLDGEAPPAGRRDGDRREKRPPSQERPQRTPPPFLDWEEERAGGRFRNGPGGPRERRLPAPERCPRSPVSEADFREQPWVRQDGRSTPPNRGLPRDSSSGDPCPPRSPSHYTGRQGLEAGPRHTLQRDGERDPARPRASPGSYCGENRELESGHRRKAGTKSRGTKGDASARPHVEAAHGRELDDAKIARRLQEEELLASQLDKRAAQVAQDEEIARLLLAEEKRAYRKAKGRETGRQDQAWKDTPEAVGSRPREGCKPPRGRSEKPTRAALTEDLDHLSSFTGQHNLVHQIAKSDPAHKGCHPKQ